jgi:hypothetical protein
VLRDRHDAGAVCPSARVRGALIRARAHTCGRCLTPRQLSNSSKAARCRMRQIAASDASQAQPGSLALQPLRAATGAHAAGSRMQWWPCQGQRASPDGHSDGPGPFPTCAPGRYGAARASSKGDLGSSPSSGGGNETLKPPTSHPTRARSIGWAVSRPGSNRLRAPEMLARLPAAQYGPPAWRLHPSFFGMGTKGLLSTVPQKISGL